MALHGSGTHADRVAVARDAALVIAAVLALALPFLRKPFHVDDDIYIKGAEQILREPWRPLGGTQQIFGDVMPTYHFTQHPPLVSYYIAALLRGIGRLDETALHLSFLVFPIVAALSMYALGRRFTRSATGATLLLVTTPAFLVMSHGLMTDLPFLAGYLAAVAAIVYGSDRARRGLWMAGAACVAATCFVQYRGLILLPLLAAYPYLHGRRARPALLAGLPAVVLIGLWSAHNRLDLGTMHLFDAGTWVDFSLSRMAGDGAAYVSFLGGATVAAPFVFYVARRHFRNAWAWPGLLVATGVLITSATAGYTTAPRALFAVFATTGVVLLAGLVPAEPVAVAKRLLARASTSDDADELFLLLMAVVPLGSQVVLNIFASARSLLVALPFVVLLLVRHLERHPFRPIALWTGVALTAAGGLVVATADLRFAQAEREMAHRAARYRAADRSGWFTGEWGFRHYVEKEGFRPVTAHGEAARAGDIVVLPEQPSPIGIDTAFLGRLEPVDAIASDTWFPVKVMSFEARAGFYSNFWGPLPYSFSKAPLERVRIFKVTAAARE